MGTSHAYWFGICLVASTLSACPAPKPSCPPNRPFNEQFHACVPSCEEALGPENCTGPDGEVFTDGSYDGPRRTDGGTEGSVSPSDVATTLDAGPIDAAGAIECDSGFASTDAACAPITAPRPVFPPVTSAVTARRPTVRWQAANGLTGAQIEFCRDRACSMLIERVDAEGDSGRPSADLPANRVVFWRLRGRVGARVGSQTSATWQFRTGLLSAAVDTAHGIDADFNGDGFSDLAVGDPAANGDRGAVSIHRGTIDGLNAAPEQSLAGGGAPFDGFGSSTASAGDVNGDGFTDLAVAAPSRTVAMRSGAGVVEIYFGSAAGVAMMPSQTLTGADMGLDFGATVVGISDVNGDGYSDLAVGRTIDRRGVRVSAVSIHLGSASGLSTAPSQVFDEGYVGSFNGEVVAIGDANGDRRQDVLLIAASGTNPRTFAGTAGGLGEMPASVLSVSRVTLRGAGDINGDGYADLTASALGEARYLAGASDWRWVESSSVGSRATGFVGDAAAMGGDINGDGYSDLVFAIESGAPAMAQLAVFRGNVSGLRASTASIGSATGIATIRARSDFNGDGLSDIAACANGRASVWYGAMLSAPLGPQSLSAGRSLTP
ncbi:MAG: FG-GAP-like repeat-containing protein [Polyangiales bacterium]